MIGVGTLINTAAVIVGGLIGLLLKNGLKEDLQKSLQKACGIATIFIGASGTLGKMFVIRDGGIETKGSMLLIFSLVIGIAIGELLRLESRMDNLGEKIKRLVHRENDNRFVDSFVNVSLIICVGAMAIVGSIQDGMSGDYSMLAAKSILDFVIVMVFASSGGVGSVFAAIPLFLYQGAITLAAAVGGSFISETIINDLSFVGSALIFCVGLNLAVGKKIPVGNLLPALVVPVAYRLILMIPWVQNIQF
ncbi:MAG: DUF554 domain-containing protein [Lachnospiraceae bacterium]